MTLDVGSDGVLCVENKLTGYSARGDALAQRCMLNFFVDTYETDWSTSDRSHSRDPSRHATRGRLRHARVSYLIRRPSHRTRTRTARPAHHNTLPNFIGHHFPCRDGEDSYDSYCGCMRSLCKPWSDTSTDLKENDESWSSVFEDFAVANTQYFRECEASACSRRDEQGGTPFDYPAEQMNTAEEQLAWGEVLTRWNEEDHKGFPKSKTRS